VFRRRRGMMMSLRSRSRRPGIGTRGRSRLGKRGRQLWQPP
jgi:hypothetical protein